MLPCAQCSQPCCRVSERGWKTLPCATVDGACVNLGADGRCVAHADRPAVCAKFDCSTDKWFRAQHPEVDALLHAEGL